jgi:TM2 domain-containing membrane protein YozV
MLSQQKNRKIAAILALASAVPLPLFGISLHAAGLHKFYLGQKWWGTLYILLAFTPIPAVAGVIEGVWYLIQDSNEFDQNFNDGVVTETIAPLQPSGAAANQVSTIAEDVRQLDQLRQDGLISEYEFEQKRRQLLDRIR